MNTQEQIIGALQVRPVIDVKEEIRERIDFLKAYCKKREQKGMCWESAEGRIRRWRDG